MSPDFDRFLFRGVTAAAVGMGPLTLEKRSLGFVDIPEGRVHACDPLVPMDGAPLALQLAPGPYEVVLFVVVGARHGGTDDLETCNAAAALVCSSHEPQRWTLAAREGQPEGACAYGVDSGTGAFMGSRALELLETDEAAGRAIIAALDGTTGSLVSIHSGVTVAAFTSGTGDGTYDTWLGFDSDCEVAMILTDFDVLRSEDYVAGVHAEWAARQRKKWWQFWR